MTGSDPTPCGCLAYDPVDNDHTADEHTSCGGWTSSGPPCGGCDSCESTRIWYHRRLEREEV